MVVMTARLALLLLLTACGEAQSPLQPPPPAPVRLEFIADSVTVEVNKPVSARFRVIDALGKPRAAPPGVYFASSAPDVVSLDATGFLVGRKVGSAIITAAYGPLRDSLRVTTLPSVLRVASSLPQGMALISGGRVLLNAHFLDGAGQVIPCLGAGLSACPIGEISWTTADSSVLRLLPGTPGITTGVALGGGVALIRASGLGRSAYLSVVVQPDLAGSDAVAVVDYFQVREGRGPANLWFYWPILRIRETSGLGALDILRVEFDLPGVEVADLCTGARLGAGSSLDLFGVTYGEYDLGFGFNKRIAGDTVSAVVYFRRSASGPLETLRVSTRVVDGNEFADVLYLPAPRWNSCG
jgi:hypothetical protein